MAAILVSVDLSISFVLNAKLDTHQRCSFKMGLLDWHHVDLKTGVAHWVIRGVMGWASNE